MSSSPSLDNWFADCFYSDPKPAFLQHNQDLEYISSKNPQTTQFLFQSSQKTSVWSLLGVNHQDSNSLTDQQSSCESTLFSDEALNQYFELSLSENKKPSFGSESSMEEATQENMKTEPLPKGWSEEKDEKLLKLASQYKGEWKLIAIKFAEKQITPRFLKNRFKTLTLAPPQKRTRFHPSEDIMIAKYFKIYGANWSKMATHFQDRTPIMLKNRYYSHIRKRGLLDFLTEKASEVENNKNMDEKAYNNMLLEMTYGSVMGSERKVSSVDFDEFPSVENTSMINSLDLNNFESTVADKDNNAISTMMEQVEILRSLYIQTKTELDELKKRVVKQVHPH